MSNFLRRFSRVRLDDTSAEEAQHPDSDENVDQALADRQQHPRTGSESTDQSLPFHPTSLENAQAFSRNVSNSGSQFPGTSQFPQPSYNEGGDNTVPVDALGLSLLHSPQEPDLDLIFVHGLGGSSMKTWSYKRDPRNFWPLWLPMETELANVRIFSFGYNANFRGPSTTLNITDFAKDLLNRMLTFAEGSGLGSPIGQFPIMFVAHSMGGLVVKKAYIWGKQDERFSSLISSVKGMIFLATPHRGASYLKTLNRILEASAPFGMSKKEYVSQLEAESSTLQDINDQFRIACGDLLLISFYETLRTNFKGIGKIIVEKSSALLDYPQEHSCPLNADHHGVCKYRSTIDENYIGVKNMLKLVASQLSSRIKRHHTKRRPSNMEIIRRLQRILDVNENPDQDVDTCKSNILEGSCQWILRKDSFGKWLNCSNSDPHVFWLTGRPATGKSTLATFVVDWIKFGFLGMSCQQHYFVNSNHVKRTTAYFLRTLALQIALNHVVIRDAILKLNDETHVTFMEQSAAVIWERIYEGIIFRTPLGGDLFWVIEALDECEDPITLCNLLFKARSVNRIRIFITSRKTKHLVNILKIHRDQVLHEELKPIDTFQDISAYVTSVIRANLPQDETIQDKTIQQILSKADGSFLWVKLTLDTIRDNWHTEQDIQKALTKIPIGMDQLYEKMLGTITNQSKRNYDIAQEIISWVVCSFRPLSLSELQAALLPKFEGFIDLEETIDQICGHFLQVNNTAVTLVHATARQFLLHKAKDFLNKQDVHSHLAVSCIRYLSSDRWRNAFTLGPKKQIGNRLQLSHYAEEHPLLSYALHHWAYHVNNASCNSVELHMALEEFFQGYVLSWIHGVSLSGELRILTHTAQHIRGFAHRRSRQQAESEEPLQSLMAQDTQWLRLWAVDLIRVLGKFGRILSEDPKSIYRLIPILCPKQSQIGSTFGYEVSSSMSISGLTYETWDDCLAHVGGTDDEFISTVLATEAYFITLQRVSGKATIWCAETYEEIHRLDHGEYVTHVALNKLGTMMVTSGILTIRTWEVSSGREIYSIPRISEAKTLAISFGELDHNFIICRDDYSIQSCDMSTGEISSTFWACPATDRHLNCPKLMELSPDMSKVIVVERGKPVFIWDLGGEREQHPWQCVGHADRLRRPDQEQAWNPAQVVRWHPDSTSIFILYLDSNLIHWNFIEDTQNEYGHINAREMIISKDGSYMLTGDSHGTLSVWSLPRFSLIYRMVYEDLVRDLAFSPDSQRIYDSRGSVCHIWEPDVLVKQEDSDKDDDLSIFDSIPESSILYDPVLSQGGSHRPQITALASHFQGHYHCIGRDDGSITIHDSSTDKKLRKVYSHSTHASVIALHWSPSGKYIVSGDDAGRVICKRLEVKEAGKWGVFPVFDLRLKESVAQLLFDTTESLLLVSSESEDILWSIRGKMKREVVRKSRTNSTGRRWVTLPSDPSKLLWIDPTSTGLFEWHTLKPLSSESSIHAQPSKQLFDRRNSLTGSTDTVVSVGLIRNGQQIVIEVVPHTGHARSLEPRYHRVQQMTLLPGPASSTTTDLGNKDVDLNRSDLVELRGCAVRLLGIFQDHVLFLDKMLWVCSLEVGTKVSQPPKKHFFLPRDWVSSSNSQLLLVNSLGSLLCPKDGEVAIIKNGIRI